MSAARKCPSSYMRCRCGSYHCRTSSNSAGHAALGVRIARNQLGKARPVLGRCLRHVERRRGHRQRLARFCTASCNPCRRGRSNAGQQSAARGSPPPDRSDSRTSERHAITSLTCAASRNLRPPYFTNGMLRREARFRAGRCGGRRGTGRPAISTDACFAGFEDLLGRHNGPERFRRHSGKERLAASICGPTAEFLVNRSLAKPMTPLRRVENRLRGPVILLKRDDARRRRRTVRESRECCARSRRETNRSTGRRRRRRSVRGRPA